MNRPSTEEQQKFYDRLWADRSRSLNSWEVQRLSRVLAGIATLFQTRNANLAICDLGCGTGWMSNELKRFGHVVGVDFSEEGVRVARETYPEVTFDQGDVLDDAKQVIVGNRSIVNRGNGDCHQLKI